MIRILKTHRRFDALRLVIKARAKNATHFAINNVLATDNHIVATDGKRLHWTANKDNVPMPPAERWLEPGQYEVIKDNQTEIMLIKIETQSRWPEWQGSTPQHTKYFDIPSFASEIGFVIARQGIFVNSQYLGDIIGKNLQKVRIWFGASDQPIKIDLNGVECVVMHRSHPEPTFGEIKTPTTAQESKP